MKKLLIALGLATTLLATPALAQPYVEATTSYNGHSADYGATLGYRLGAITLEGGAENFFETPTYVGTIGLEAKIAGPVSGYAQGGFISRSGDSGYRLGAGAALDLTKHLYVKGGYERDDYGHGSSDAVTAGLGIKF